MKHRPLAYAHLNLRLWHVYVSMCTILYTKKKKRCSRTIVTSIGTYKSTTHTGTYNSNAPISLQYAYVNVCGVQVNNLEFCAFNIQCYPPGLTDHTQNVVLCICVILYIAFYIYRSVTHTHTHTLIHCALCTVHPVQSSTQNYYWVFNLFIVCII